MSLNSLAQALLPAPLYHRLAASSIAKRLARGSLWSLFGSATSRLLVLVAMVLVARLLGQAPFGEFGLIQATLGVVGLMAGLGLGGTATRFVAQYAVADPTRAGRVIALVTSVSVGAVLFAVGVLVAASGLIAHTVLKAPHLQTALIWGALLMGVTAFRGIQSGVLAGLEKFDLIAKLNILDSVVAVMAMVLLARFMGVEGALFGLALGAIVAGLVGHNLLMNELRTQSITVSYKGCWADWRILSGYSLPGLLANMVATPVLWLCMTLVARTPNGYAELGIYNAAYQWHGPMVFIPMVLMSVSIPVLVQEWEAGRRERFRQVVFGICGLVLAISLPPVLLAAFLSPWIMSLYGSGFIEGEMVLVLLLAAAPLHALAKIASGALLGMNRAWWVFGINLIWGITILTVALWLTPTLEVKGLAIAFLMAYGILGALSFGLVLIGSRLPPVTNHTARMVNHGEIS
ncbi:MAG: oligosaccharide flippase family protein [Candidatus Polarisedimenticolaceae bacterium]|nr:oligosaccharide flippase family protein [Candidatus Polarisedimenticolaceae bacterium]